jgi:hypothetical protein
MLRSHLATPSASPQRPEHSRAASDAPAGTDTEAAAEGVMALADRAEEQGRSPDAYVRVISLLSCIPVSLMGAVGCSALHPLSEY